MSDDVIAQLKLQESERKQQAKLTEEVARDLAASSFAQAQAERKTVRVEFESMEDEAVELGRWRVRSEALSEELHVPFALQ